MFHDEDGNLSRLQNRASKKRKTKLQKEAEEKERDEAGLTAMMARQTRIEQTMVATQLRIEEVISSMS